MLDTQDVDAMAVIVNAVAHSILASSRTPQPLERRTQGGSDNTWALGQRAPDEFPRSKGSDRGEGVRQRSASPR